MKKRSPKYRAHLVRKSVKGNAQGSRRTWIRYKKRRPTPLLDFVASFDGFTGFDSREQIERAARQFAHLKKRVDSSAAASRQSLMKGRLERPPVRINLRDHVGFDPIALMRFFLLVEYASQVGVDIIGNFPRDDLARRQLEEIGFFEGVPPSHKCVSLRKGYRTDRETARELAQFLAGGLAREDDSSLVARRLAQRFYAPFFECIQNVYAHAAGDDSKKGCRPWYAFGYVNPDTGTATAVVGDAGVGIRKSLRNKDNLLRRLLKSDAQFIREILIHGRSSHPGRGRGKGLRELRKLATRGARLAVASGRGVITVEGKTSLVLNTPSTVDGTIVAFSISPSERLL